MRRIKALSLSAILAAAMFGPAPAVAQSSFRDDGSVVVNRGVLDGLGPELTSPDGRKKPAAIKSPPRKIVRKPQPARVAQPAKAPAPASTPTVAPKVAEPAAPARPAEPSIVVVPAKPAEPVRPVDPVKAAEPAAPVEPAKVAEPARPAEAVSEAEKQPEPVRTRLVGRLTEPLPSQDIDIPAAPPVGASKVLPSARGATPPAPAVIPAPASTPAPAAEPRPAVAETKVAAVVPPPAPAAPAPTPRGLVTPQPASPPSPPVQQPPARVEPVASRAGTGIEQRDGGLRMLFSNGDATLPDGSHAALEGVARRMEAEPQLYLQLLAYAEGTEDEASKARRLSLSRALAVRSYLMNYGVRSTRIEVRALGNKIPDGPADRVDLVIDKR